MKHLSILIAIFISLSSFGQNIDIRSSEKHYREDDTIRTTYNTNVPNGLETALKYLAKTGDETTAMTVDWTYTLDLGDYRIYHIDTIAKLKAIRILYEALGSPLPPTDPEPPVAEDLPTALGPTPKDGTIQQALNIQWISLSEDTLTINASEFADTLEPLGYDIVINGTSLGILLTKNDLDSYTLNNVQIGQLCVQVESVYPSTRKRSNKKCINID